MFCCLTIITPSWSTSSFVNSTSKCKFTQFVVHPKNRVIGFVHSCFPCSNPWSAWASKRRCVPRSCSITWHSFSPWHNLSKLSSAHGLPKELLLVVKVVQVVFYVSTSNHSIFRKNLIIEHQKCKYCLLKHQLYDACTKRDEGATAMVSHNIMNAERLHKAACWRYSLVDDKAT